MNFALLSIISDHSPAETSTRTVLHFAQGVTSHRLSFPKRYMNLYYTRQVAA